MQNIDPVYLIQPAVSLAFSAALVVVWYHRKGLTIGVLVAAALAYSTAILLKVAFQAATAKSVIDYYGYVSIPSALYFGLQTSVFEVGITYVVVRFAVSRGRATIRHGGGFGISLAFWENGILLGLFSFINLAIAYGTIAAGNIPQGAYEALVMSNPSLFLPPARAAQVVVLGIVERISSLFVHFSWGYLCVMAACLKRPRYFLAALPMGLVDATVPFSSDIPLWEFEFILFVLTLFILLVTWAGTKNARATYVETRTVREPSATEREAGP